MNWPISSTLVNNSISTKRKETFPLLSSLILFFGQSFCSGSLDNSWGKWETDADLFLATKLSGQSAILATCAFWQTTTSSKHSIIKERPLSLPLWCVVSHIVLSIAAFIFSWWLVCFLQRYVMVVHFLWFAIFRSF